MGKRNKTVVGRYADARTGAEKLCGENVFAAPSISQHDWERMIQAAEKQALRHFNKRKTKINYASVTRAYFKHWPWQKSGLPKSTFFDARKKVENYFKARKHWAKSMSEQTEKGKTLD